MSGRRTQSESRITTDKSVTDSWADSLDRDISFESRHPPERDFGNHVYHECDIYLLKQIDLAKDEPFSRERIQSLLEKYYNSKQTHCRLYMFDDSMRFERIKTMGRRVVQSDLRYEDIKRCSTFRSKPNALVLCTSNQFGDKRACELFRCKSLVDLNKICDLIDKATQSKTFRLSQRPIVYNDNLKLTNYTNNKSRTMSADSVQNLSQKPKSLIGDYSEYSKKTCDEAVGSWRISKRDYYRRNSLKEIKPCEVENRQLYKSDTHDLNSLSYQVVASHSSTKQTVYEPKLSLYNQEFPNESKQQKSSKLPRIKIDRDFTSPFQNWDDAVTYLQIHPIYGPQINGRGPIYMYALQL
uniref:Trematode PH-like domain-containing protein n=1 Tax=Trichobilharzia regenti TaxID=157069 RepID=A0AA85JIP1_TRIRE|nr:unnamed protein product [Trichobilharzia regenti]